MKNFFYVLLFLLCFNILSLSSLLLRYDNGRNLDINKNILNQKIDVSRRDGRRRENFRKNWSKRSRSESEQELSSESSSDSQSSLEKMKWKDEFQQIWLQKKLEAINSTIPKGDTVNMVAARPWGVSCGDPNQHNMKWGSCMLPMECESEYRIYRGDYLCGHTKFVCCSLQLTNYDLYDGFDISFEDTSLETDTEEKKYRDNKNKKETKAKQRERQRRKRRRERAKRKKRIKKVIRRIMREIRKILVRQYRNTTLKRKEKTKQLKKFIKMLKEKHLHDRKLVKGIHEQELIKLDHDLQKRLLEVRDMNQQFNKNTTFKDIIANGSVKRIQVRTLKEKNHELDGELDTRRRGADTPDYLEYDIEYGYIYV